MDQLDEPAVLDGPELSEASEAKAPAKAPEISAADSIAADKGVDGAYKSINAQPKTRIRIIKEQGPQVVIINGARFNVPSNVYVEVPEQVAQLLQESGRI